MELRLNISDKSLQWHLDWVSLIIKILKLSVQLILKIEVVELLYNCKKTHDVFPNTVLEHAIGIVLNWFAYFAFFIIYLKYNYIKLKLNIFN